MQVLFESPTVEKLALRVDGENVEPASRLVPLRAGGSKSPVYCWPGLGGYTMNLRPLAAKSSLDRPFYGVQAHGINEGETAYPTIREMAAQDVDLIRRTSRTARTRSGATPSAPGSRSRPPISWSRPASGWSTCS